jgi:hypothetical protein
MMAVPGRLAAMAAICTVAPGIFGGAFARVLETEYSVSVRGVPIGSAQLSARIEDGEYAIELTSRMSGLVRIFLRRRGFRIREGDRDGRRAAPGGIWPPLERGRRYGERRVEFAGTDATSIAIDPPIKRPKRYVPIKPEHKHGVLDPASAFIWPAGSADGEQVCNRVLPLFDGKRRFDLSFAYSRLERFETRDGSYSGRAFVCSIRYTPIAGHRLKKRTVQQMAANKDMEIWMAPVGDGGHVAPVKLRVGTKYGRIVLEAKRFATK